MRLDTFSNLIKTIRDLPREAGIAISDDSRFIYYQPGERIDLHIKPGEELREGTVSLKTLQIKKEYSTYVDENIFGTPYYGVGYPIINNGDVEGVITAILPLNKNFYPSHPFLIGREEDFWVPVPLQDIYFIEASEGKTLLHTKNGILINKYSLSELELRLPNDLFFRCHRSYLIQIKEISEIQPSFHSTFLLKMRDDKRSVIPVSQSYASRFRNLLGF